MGAAAAAAHVLKDFAAVLLGQIDIQNQQIRTGRGVIAIGALEELDGPLAVLNKVDRSAQVRGCERLLNEKNVGPVVFHDQNMRSAASRFLRPGE